MPNDSFLNDEVMEQTKRHKRDTGEETVCYLPCYLNDKRLSRGMAADREVQIRTHWLETVVEGVSLLGSCFADILGLRLSTRSLPMTNQPAANNDGLFRIGLIGHRTIPASETVERLRAEARELFQDWHAHYAQLEVLSPLAIGADTILTEVALEYNATLIAVVPFKDYEKDFAVEDREQYRMMLYRAQDVHEMPFAERSTGAYLVAGIWIVDHVDVIVAAWDGQPARGTGGTADVVQYAQERAKPIHVFHTPR
jgi:hypothetical protein